MIWWSIDGPIVSMPTSRSATGSDTWRHGRSADQAPARILYEIVEEELGGLLHHGVGPRQERAIRVEQVVLPQVLRQPRGAGRPQSGTRQIARRREPPDVADVVRTEPARTVVQLGRLAAGSPQRLEIRKQWLVQLGEVGDFRRP